MLDPIQYPSSNTLFEQSAKKTITTKNANMHSTTPMLR